MKGIGTEYQLPQRRGEREEYNTRAGEAMHWIESAAFVKVCDTHEMINMGTDNRLHMT